MNQTRGMHAIRCIRGKSSGVCLTEVLGKWGGCIFESLNASMVAKSGVAMRQILVGLKEGDLTSSVPRVAIESIET